MDPGGLLLLLSGRYRGEMGESDEPNSVRGAREGLCQKGYPRASRPSLCVMGGGPESTRDMPEVTQHIRDTASTRIRVSWQALSLALEATGLSRPLTYSERGWSRPVFFMPGKAG